jgi:Prokaryotic E2 family E
MQLPARDTAFLTERQYVWELVPDAGGGVCLIVKGFDVTGGGFMPRSTDLMIRIPPQYPMTPLDMWYCDPPIRFSATGQFAQASEVMEPHIGRSWQRFSRHLNGGWQPSVDSLRSFFILIQRELQGTGKK